MPDTLEMPYRPDVFQIVRDASLRSARQPAVQMAGESYALAGNAGEGSHTYRLGAPTCLAGDRIGDYSFAEPLAAGDELVFDDMAHYTMVKTTFSTACATRTSPSRGRTAPWRRCAALLMKILKPAWARTFDQTD